MIARFERGRAESDFGAEVDIEDLVNYLFAFLQGLAVQAGSGATPAELERTIELALKLWPTR